MSARQRPYPPPITREQLLPFGFSDPDAAAENVNGLLEAISGPADDLEREVWRMLAEEELAPRAMARFLRQAARAPDPLAYLDRGQAARGLVNARMRVQWSSRHARSSGHPTSLAGVAWSSLTDPARGMVREALLRLADYEDAVSRGTTCRKDRTDSVIRELAEIFLEGRAAFRSALNSIGHALPPGFAIKDIRYCAGENEVANVVEFTAEKLPNGSQCAVLFRFGPRDEIVEERCFVDTEQWKAAF